MDVSERRDLTQQVHRSTGSFELVFSPLLLGLLGFVLDRWLGTLPIITIVFSVAGLLGACVKLYCGYKTEMDQHEATAPWAKRS